MCLQSWSDIKGKAREYKLKRRQKTGNEPLGPANKLLDDVLDITGSEQIEFDLGEAGLGEDSRDGNFLFFFLLINELKNFTIKRKKFSRYFVMFVFLFNDFFIQFYCVFLFVLYLLQHFSVLINFISFLFQDLHRRRREHDLTILTRRKRVMTRTTLISTSKRRPDTITTRSKDPPPSHRLAEKLLLQQTASARQ